MRLLLDTHILLWWLADDPELSSDARNMTAKAEVVFVSVASVWEITVKQALGKLVVPGDLTDQLEHHRFTVLPIHLNHALHLAQLPSLHRDPFDRMLIAQAQIEQLTVVTRDSNIADYEIEIIIA